MVDRPPTCLSGAIQDQAGAAWIAAKAGCLDEVEVASRRSDLVVIQEVRRLPIDHLAARRTSARGSTRSSGGGRRRKVPIRSSSSRRQAERGLRARGGGERSLGFGPPGVAREQRPGGGDAAAGDDVQPLEAVLGGRREQAELQRAQSFQLRERRNDVLERRDPVA